MPGGWRVVTARVSEDVAQGRQLPIDISRASDRQKEQAGGQGARGSEG